MSHLFEEKHNNQNCLMKIIEYSSYNNIIVEFQDEYRFRVNTNYGNFKLGCVRNPYHPTIYNIGVTGYKHPTKVNGKQPKEYRTWVQMLQRCYDNKLKEKQPTYKDVVCCDEWLNYENFYEWLESQDNFGKWLNGYRWALDKDILIKGNKLYSPETCCLVPQNVNCLLLKRDASRGDLPLGVKQIGSKFEANCGNPFTGKCELLGRYDTIEEAFYAYKIHREGYIKQIAKTEYNIGNITKRCYEALMNYNVEIDD